jgi:hypothetical protein
MGNILNYLQNTGSQYTYYDGITPPANPFNTQDSLLHYDRKTRKGGYSTLGAEMENYPQFFNQWISNLPVTTNPYLPANSQLELDDPIGVDTENKPKYTSVPGRRYQDQKFK